MASNDDATLLTFDNPFIAVQLHHPASGVGADRRDDVNDERRRPRWEEAAAAGEEEPL